MSKNSKSVEKLIKTLQEYTTCPLSEDYIFFEKKSESFQNMPFGREYARRALKKLTTNVNVDK
jgi:hypothetical protein